MSFLKEPSPPHSFVVVWGAHGMMIALSFCTPSRSHGALGVSLCAFGWGSISDLFAHTAHFGILSACCLLIEIDSLGFDTLSDLIHDDTLADALSLSLFRYYFV